MDPRESLHVADLGKANFSAAMSNVDEPKRWYAPGRLTTLQARKCIVSAFDFQKEMVAIDCLKF